LFFLLLIGNHQSDDLKEHLLVMEYADSGTLRNYLKERFVNLTWNDKLNLALQLARAVSCLHDEGIAHRDLVINLYYIINKCIISLIVNYFIIYNCRTQTIY
jgi:serine/threonine protein kinase